mmetsp:Transcript_5417/g.22175  ORF Transcript_5417/g.22175 Transcript_5417/m.22175 type:complete len:314 (+) Transcript_5417:1359-2300(+)
MAADSLERGGADAEVLRGFLEMFREVFLEHLERDAPRRLGVARARGDAVVVLERVDVGQPAQGVERANVRRDGLHAGAGILGIARGAVHRERRTAVQVVPDGVDAGLLLLGRGQVARKVQLEHSLRLLAVLLLDEHPARAHAVEPEERGGVVQRPLHLRPILHVVHPDDASLLHRPPHGPLPPPKRDLLGELAVRQGHHVTHAERRAGRDEPLAGGVRQPGLRQQHAQRSAHLRQRLRVGIAQRVNRVRHHLPHRGGRTQRAGVAGVEPVRPDGAGDRLEQRAGEHRLTVHHNLHDRKRNLLRDGVGDEEGHD